MQKTDPDVLALLDIGIIIAAGVLIALGVWDLVKWWNGCE